ncbi:SUMF1/EgtB/PvdO family nonheme iron enzyme [Desulfoluna spongiiphila]|uniref:SUMF1/EgtB/PvdO family nonheme iron enzyme n=1 Tax=Desulfoluna spongiiphila TaxID=419481 RepID=UPI0012525029|nr:SUMF1/EgtB/PvdO family nonheme iron enzyme [Desulfoluna spongiiphila]VVS94841.1 c-type lectin fold [Desulfoluna spongiiphila]
MARAIRPVVMFLLTAVWTATALADVKAFDELERRQGSVGSYKALVIGIDTYADPGIEGSPAAVEGARHVADALKGRAGFDVKLLINEAAGRAAVMREFRGLARGMGINDSVLIYFSGSSHTDKAARKAWWLPSDARPDDPATWIADDEIQEAVNVMKARDVLILSDAALGDTMFGATHRLASRRDGEYYVELFNKRSRWAMISGNVHPVAGEGGVSVFARGVASALSSKGPCLTTMEMFSGMKKELRKSGTMPPRCRSLRNTGDQGGEFVFLLSAPAPAPVVVKAPRIKPKAAPVAVVKLVPPKPKPTRKPVDGRLKVSSNITGAELYINGKKQGITPVSNIALKEGTHEVRLSKEGYLAWNGSIDIERGKERSLTATLEKEPPQKGKLFVKVKPGNASIRLDGAAFKSGGTVEAGTHTVKVSAPLFKSGKAKVVVSSGKDAWVEVFLTPRDSFKGEWGHYVFIKPGTFTMGSPDTESRRKEDESAHSVTLTRGFFMQDKEVTVAQWQAFVDDSGYKSEAETAGGAYALEDYVWTQSREYSWKNPGFSQSGDHPVTGITSADIQAFLKWVNKESKYTYRLPTEAEWEYAARAGESAAFSTGACLGSADANVDANASWGECPAGAASNGTLPVGTFTPNAWGLYDMHGNVAEWCRDWYGRYPQKSVKNPTGAASGTNRVVRGGGWATYAYNARCAKREAVNPSRGCSEVGMRLVVEIPK